MLGWLDNSGHYWSLALAAITITTLLAIAPAFHKSRAALTRYAFVVMLLLTLLAGRWPVIATSSTLEFDESFYVATAMTAAVHPTPWKSFDPATVGPLEIYFLDIPKLFGIGISYASTHFMAVLVLWGLLTSLYLFLRRFVDETAARIAVLPALIFLTFTFSGEFEHYASELFALFLISLALVAAVMPWTERRSAIISAVLTGIIIGALPFAKTQAVPLGMLVGVAFMALMPWRNRAAARSAFLTFIGSLFVIPVLLIGFVAAKGALGDFVMSYIRMQINYVAGASTPLSFIFSDPHFSEYVLVSLSTSLAAIALASALGDPAPVPLRTRSLPLGALALIATSLFVMFVPHKPWTHYVFFLLPSLTVLVGSTVGLLYARINGERWKQGVAVFAALLILVPMVRESRTAKNPLVGNVVATRALPPNLPVSIMRGIARPGDRMALWGLDSDLYPATGLLMGTREGISYFQMTPTPLLGYFRARYVSDMIANKPRLFVDAVAPGMVNFTDRKTEGFEVFTELAAVVRSKYQLACDIEGIRIFQLRGPSASNVDCPIPPKTVKLSGEELTRLRPIAAPRALGFIDSLVADGVPGSLTVFSLGSKITANGWAVDPVTRKPGSALIFIVDDRLRSVVSQAYGRERPDVAVAMKSADADYTGFVDAPIATRALAAGPHSVQFGVVSADGKRFYLSAAPVAFTVR